MDGIRTFEISDHDLIALSSIDISGQISLNSKASTGYRIIAVLVADSWLGDRNSEVMWLKNAKSSLDDDIFVSDK
jgi:hypothetical protein